MSFIVYRHAYIQYKMKLSYSMSKNYSDTIILYLVKLLSILKISSVPAISFCGLKIAMIALYFPH